MQVILETERLFLRKMTMEDFDSLYVVLADSDIMQHYPYALDEKRVREWIGRNMKRYEENGFGLWAVCLKDTGEIYLPSKPLKQLVCILTKSTQMKQTG